MLAVDDVAARLGCSRPCAIGVMGEAGAVMFSVDSNKWRIESERLERWLKADLAQHLISLGVPKRSVEFVYFIECNRGPIKIGYTKDVEKRIEHIQMLCPYEVRLRGLMYGSKRLEYALHGRFRALRIRGEWFRQEGELASMLEMAR